MEDTKKKKIIKWFWILVAAPFALLFTLILLVWIFARIPSFEELEHPDNKLATQVISSDGVTLATFHIENRTYVPYEDLSVNLVNAAVSTEDVRFYKHSGIDLKGLGRVFFKTLLLRDSSQGGGSTITQQLAKTLYPRAEVSGKVPGWSKVVMVWTKLKEWITAVKLERNYTKNEIMNMYLNSVFFGSGAYGVKAASETFFAKAPADLTVEEAAMLIGMVNKPTRYNPILNPDYALGRRNFVIGRMAKNNFISQQEADSIKQIPIVCNYHLLDHNSGLAPYFRDMLRRTMNAREPKRSDYSYPEEYSADSLRWEDDDLYGWLTKNRKGNRGFNLDKDGLRIYTTINSKMQRYAEEAVSEHLGKHLQSAFDREMRWKPNRPFSNDTPKATEDMLMRQARRWSDRYRCQKKAGVPEKEILAQFSKPVKMKVFTWKNKSHVKDTVMSPDDSIRYYKGILRAGFMAMEPGTGNVLAYVGGPNYKYFKYDNVSQGKRQVGSTIKPFLYTLAMLNESTPCDKVVNVPQTFILPTGDEWTPRSTDKEEWIGQTVTLKWGLTQSSNNISAYLMGKYGPAPMVRIMRNMGITGHLEEVYSLCVGSADLSLYEMVPSYNTFPSLGVYSSPLLVTRIESNSGETLAEFTNKKREAIGEKTAYTMINMMENVVNHGTGIRLRYVYGLQGRIAGKTGTTNDNSDGWFIGYTPFVTAGVWVGCEDRQAHFNSTSLGQGSNTALPIWGIFMKKCLADKSIGWDDQQQFVCPVGVEESLDCEGGDNDAGTVVENIEEHNYFD